MYRHRYYYMQLLPVDGLGLVAWLLVWGFVAWFGSCPAEVIVIVIRFLSLGHGSRVGCSEFCYVLFSWILYWIISYYVILEIDGYNIFAWFCFWVWLILYKYCVFRIPNMLLLSWFWLDCRIPWGGGGVSEGCRLWGGWRLWILCVIG